MPDGSEHGLLELLGSLPIVEGVKETIKNPRSMINDRGEFSLTRFLSKEFRDEKTTERKLQEKLLEQQASAQAFQTANAVGSLLTDIAGSQNLTLEQQAAAGRRAGTAGREAGFSVNDRDFFDNIRGRMAVRDQARNALVETQGLDPRLSSALGIRQVGEAAALTQRAGQDIRVGAARGAQDRATIETQNEAALEQITRRAEAKAQTQQAAHLDRLAELNEKGEQTRESATARGGDIRTRGRIAKKRQGQQQRFEERVGRREFGRAQQLEEQEVQGRIDVEQARTTGRLAVGREANEGRIKLEREKATLEERVRAAQAKLDRAGDKATAFQRRNLARLNSQLDSAEADLDLSRDRELVTFKAGSQLTHEEFVSDLRSDEIRLKSAGARKAIEARGTEERRGIRRRGEQARETEAVKIDAREKSVLLRDRLETARGAKEHEQTQELQRIRFENNLGLAKQKAKLTQTNRKITTTDHNFVSRDLQEFYATDSNADGDLIVPRAILPLIDSAEETAIGVLRETGQLETASAAGRMAVAEQLNAQGVSGPLFIPNLDQIGPRQSFMGFTFGDREPTAFNLAMAYLQAGLTDTRLLHKQLGRRKTPVPFDITDANELTLVINESLREAGIPTVVLPGGALDRDPVAWSDAGLTDADFETLGSVLQEVLG